METTDATEQEALEGFVTPGSDNAKVPYFDIKEDDTVTLRIFPATKSLAGKSFCKYASVYFWQIRDRRDDSKTRSFPILSLVEKDFNKGGMITQTDPIYDLRKKVEDKVKIIEAKGKERNASKADVAKAAGPYQKWLKNHGEQGRYRCYAMDKNGNVGIFRFAATVRKQLVAAIKELEADGETPLDRKGVFFKFSRTGTFNTTEYKVQPARVKREDGSSVLDYHFLTKEVWGKVMALPDINDEIERLRQPLEVMEALAKLPLDADPSESNKILGIESEQQQASEDGDGGVSDSGSLDDGDFGVGAQSKGGDSGLEADNDEAAEAAAVAAAAAAEAAARAAVKAAAAKAAAAKAPATATTKPAAKPPVTSKPAPKAPVAEPASESFDDIFPNT